MEFINKVEKKTKENFKEIFKRPELILSTAKKGFLGELNLKYKIKWFKPNFQKKLNKTGKIIIKEVINPKKNERVGCGFTLIPASEKFDEPLEDYLDSYAICMCVINNSPGT